MSRKYKKAVIGGTFDKLHKGHVKLIEKALEIGNFVLIGLTTDMMVQSSSKKHKVSKFKKRQENLIKFLNKKRVMDRIQIIPINDPYGPTIEENEIDVIVVSKETYPRAVEINNIRKNKKLRILDIIMIDMVLSENGLPISTSRIRKNEIDSEGYLK